MWSPKVLKWIEIATKQSNESEECEKIPKFENLFLLDTEQEEVIIVVSLFKRNWRIVVDKTQPYEANFVRKYRRRETAP